VATLMTLVDNGTLKLDDKISKFYPVEFGDADRRDITI
jgi:CubicO group peptidase (beta-lactamase class C family)